MSDLETKRSTENALKAFAAQPLKVGATGLFHALGYASKKTLELKPNGTHKISREEDPNKLYWYDEQGNRVETPDSFQGMCCPQE